jgi:hypothetical protein
MFEHDTGAPLSENENEHQENIYVIGGVIEL